MVRSAGFSRLKPVLRTERAVHSRKARRDVIEDLEQRPPPYQPTNPLWDGVYTFVGYPSNFRMMALF